MENKSRKITWYAVLIGLAYLAIQHGMYLLGHEFALLLKIPAFLPKIPAIDDAIPIISVFIIPYIWSYAFWAMGPVAVYKCEEKHYKDFMAGVIVALVLGMIALAVAPTYMDRNAEHLYDIRTGDIFEKMRLFWYTLDGETIAYNLLPSFHCLNSTLCYLGVMGRKELPLWFRIYSFVMAILTYVATVCVKQHYFLDIFAGIAVAVIGYAVAKKFHLGRMFDPIIKKFKKP